MDILSRKKSAGMNIFKANKRIAHDEFYLGLRLFYSSYVCNILH